MTIQSENPNREDWGLGSVKFGRASLIWCTDWSKMEQRVKCGVVVEVKEP